MEHYQTRWAVDPDIFLGKRCRRVATRDAA